MLFFCHHASPGLVGQGDFTSTFAKGEAFIAPHLMRSLSSDCLYCLSCIKLRRNIAAYMRSGAFDYMCTIAAFIFFFQISSLSRAGSVHLECDCSNGIILAFLYSKYSCSATMAECDVLVDTAACKARNRASTPASLSCGLRLLGFWRGVSITNSHL